MLCLPQRIRAVDSVGAFKSANFTCHITQRARPTLPSSILNGRLRMCVTTPCDSTATVGLTFMVLCEMFGHGWVPSRVGACRLFVLKTVWDPITFTYINLHKKIVLPSYCPYDQIKDILNSHCFTLTRRG